MFSKNWFSVALFAATFNLKVVSYHFIGTLKKNRKYGVAAQGMQNLADEIQYPDNYAGAHIKGCQPQQRGLRARSLLAPTGALIL